MSAILGLPGDLVVDTAELSPTQWKAGGRAIVSTTFGRSDSSFKCRICSESLHLVAQVTDGAETPQHAYLVFGCIRQGCGRQEGSWRGFSIFIQASISQTDPGNEERKSVPTPAKAQPASKDWGTAALEWGIDGPDCQPSEKSGAAPAKSIGNIQVSGLGDQKKLLIDSLGDPPQRDSPSHPADTRENFDDLLKKLDKALNLQQENDRRAKPAERFDNMGTESRPSIGIQFGHGALPEFHLWKSGEPVASESHFSRKEQQHIQELLEKYQQEEATLTLASGPAKEAEAGPSIAWQGEKYEKTSVSAVDAAFMKFTKRLRRSPDQCLRLGGELLWPSQTLPAGSLDPCSTCGAQLDFILQLTPALMPLIEEAAMWLGDTSEAKPSLPDWDWATVACFGCRVCMTKSQTVNPEAAEPDMQELVVAIFNEDFAGQGTKNTRSVP